MKRKPYPAYKPSGVEWLGAVPKHWEVKRARFKVLLNPSKQEIGSLPKDMEVSFLPMESVGEDGGLNLEQSRPIEEVETGYTYFSNGDVTYAKITPCFENRKGAIMTGLQNGFGFGSTELTVLRPRGGVSKEYLYYITLSNEFRKSGEAWMYGAGGQKRVPDNFVREFSFVWPPFPEQQAIASFLDRETGKIDTLINKNQRLIELLKEKRTALISRAVTKGLGPTVKMKPSGVEWLGDVPEHWEVTRLKNAFHVYNGSTPESSKEEFWDGDITWYTPEDLGNNARKNILDSRRKITQSGYANIGATIVPKSSIIISTRAPIGHIAITDVPACTNQGCRSLVPKKNVWSDFHYYYLLTSKNNLNAIGKGTTFIELGNQGLEGYLVPLPPLPEQQAIADFLDKETGKIDALIAKVEKAIEKLKEYRTALISAAVTGKIDVREAA
ncbi:MAG: Type-1 restriction enzyme EcoKI specificity protein [Syntrophorhabdus sp. PtaU1.Bin050]|nr:MAG: Type-1 restriction enzyme EcoKI specificity protein [Syntrophorhabdus sp. PtaU1.Bin050]